MKAQIPDQTIYVKALSNNPSWPLQSSPAATIYCSALEIFPWSDPIGAIAQWESFEKGSVVLETENLFWANRRLREYLDDTWYGTPCRVLRGSWGEGGT